MCPSISLPEFKWLRGAEQVEYSVPDSWCIQVCQMAGFNRPALTTDEIQKAIAHPLHTARISELARGKKEAVILFDDTTRVTRTYEIAPFVLQELEQAGIAKEHIRFIAATGLHGVMGRADFIRKLGQDIVAHYPVYNHNPFGNCVYAGTTLTYQTRVELNAEVMKCDFKVAIGQVVPHHSAGYSGGGKLVMPGIASFETVQYNHLKGHHSKITCSGKATMGMGLYDENPMRRDIDESAAFCGIDFLLNVLVNGKGETCALFAGEMNTAHAAAMSAAKSHYLTPASTGNDIVITNLFSENNVTSVGLLIACPAVREGGDIVLIASYPDGIIPHYLTGRWGRDTWAVQHRRVQLPGRNTRLLVYNKFHQPGNSWFDADERISYFSEWEDVLACLQERHAENAQVAVFPNADIQYCGC